MRRFRNQAVGFALLFIGISVVVGLIDFGYALLGPLFLFGIGYITYQHLHRWIGYFFFGSKFSGLNNNPSASFPSNIFHFTSSGLNQL